MPTQFDSMLETAILNITLHIGLAYICKPTHSLCSHSVQGEMLFSAVAQTADLPQGEF